MNFWVKRPWKSLQSCCSNLILIESYTVVISVSDWVVSLCLCRTYNKAKRKVVLSAVHGWEEEKGLMCFWKWTVQTAGQVLFFIRLHMDAVTRFGSIFFTLHVVCSFFTDVYVHWCCSPVVHQGLSWSHYIHSVWNWVILTLNDVVKYMEIQGLRYLRFTSFVEFL